ncbi:nucleotidyltransferase family protein [Sphingorhabdus arenilitoris]|uniref:Nucleotidyltransferase family protein n=1 Tax=Sphingorhabdus arenilitoris TaxID=1490041 RepID=A0ABV8RH00_9SPHN
MSKTAMVMAAGLGTRMRPLTNDRPKPLVMLGGKTLIDHSLDKLREAGVDNVVVNVHYLPDMVTAHLSENAADLNITISDERDLLLETGGGLIKALPFLPEDPFYCVNSDNIWTENGGVALTKLAAAWDAEIMDALLLVVPTANAHNHKGAGDFYMDDTALLERRGDRDSAPFIYTGIQLISHRLLRDPPGGAFSTNIFWSRAIQEGRLHGMIHSGEWFDIGSPEAISPTEARLAELARAVNA